MPQATGPRIKIQKEEEKKKKQTYESQASVVRLYSLKPGQVELTS